MAVVGSIARHVKRSKGWTEFQKDKQREREAVAQPNRDQPNRSRANQMTLITRMGGFGCVLDLIGGSKGREQHQSPKEAETADNQTSERDTLAMQWRGGGQHPEEL